MDRSSRTFPPGYVEESAGGSTIGVAIAFIILEIAFFTLRLISRRLHQAKLGLDDILTVPSLIFCLAMCVLAIVGVRLCGIGRHLDVLIELEPRLLARWAKWAYATEQVYCVSVAFPKLSILASYLRVFTEKPYRVAVYVIGLITSLNAIVGVIVSLAACRPFSARWHSDGSGLSKCIDFGLYYRWIGFPNIITDVAILLLPLPVIWTLQISRNQKYGLSLVFLTGSIGILASVMRFATFFAAQYSDTLILAKLTSWALVEPGAYLIAACLLTLRPLMRHLYAEASRMKKKSAG